MSLEEFTVSSSCLEQRHSNLPVNSRSVHQLNVSINAVDCTNIKPDSTLLETLVIIVNVRLQQQQRVSSRIVVSICPCHPHACACADIGYSGTTALVPATAIGNISD